MNDPVPLWYRVLLVVWTIGCMGSLIWVLSLTTTATKQQLRWSAIAFFTSCLGEGALLWVLAFVLPVIWMNNNLLH